MGLSGEGLWFRVSKTKVFIHPLFWEMKHIINEAILMKTCPKCNGKVVRKGVIKSGNSNYGLWKCEACGHEEMQCEGLI